MRAQHEIMLKYDCVSCYGTCKERRCCSETLDLIKWRLHTATYFTLYLG